jgi:hypothetical protein
MAKQDDVRLIAYHIWEDEGCCDGSDVDHWLRAEMIWEAMGGNKSRTPAKTKAAEAQKATPTKTAAVEKNSSKHKNRR